MPDQSSDRKGHIIRIIGTNANRDKLTYMWADIFRIDEYATIVGGGDGRFGVYQKKKHKLSWQDDINAGETGNPSRMTTTKKLCDPSEPDQQNPSEWIPIDVTTDYVTMVSGWTETGAGDDQKKKNRFQVPDNTSGNVQDIEFDVVRVTHFDTNLDNDSTYTNGGVIPFEDYVRIVGTEDKDNYLDIAIPKSIKVRVSGQTQTGAGVDQIKVRRFNNAYLVEQFQTPIDPPLNPPPFDPPWILDPYQYVINVNLGGLAVEFLDGAG